MSRASGTPDSEMLDVAAVMDRYGLRDRRAARRVMDIAGGFMVAGRLVVRRDDLLRHEEDLIQARSRAPAPQPQVHGARARAPSRKGQDRREPLPPGWWRAT